MTNNIQHTYVMNTVTKLANPLTVKRAEEDNVLIQYLFQSESNSFWSNVDLKYETSSA